MHSGHLGGSRGDRRLGYLGGEDEEDRGDHQVVLLGGDCVCHHHVLPPPPPGCRRLHPHLRRIPRPFRHRSLSSGSGGRCGGHVPR